MSIPVIDIFAGPGGLGEGFSTITDEGGEKIFKTVLSIEMDKYAHQTLLLRSFYRQFQYSEVPSEYYDFLKQKISLNTLFEAFPKQAADAKEEAWCARLGDDNKSEPFDNVYYRIQKALKGCKDWVLPGRPDIVLISSVLQYL